MKFTFSEPQFVAIQEFMINSVKELLYLGIKEEDIIIQLPETHYKTILYFIHRSIFPDHGFFAENGKVHFCGVEMHPIGYESKVVVYYKHVSYKRKELIRTMDI